MNRPCSRCKISKPLGDYYKCRANKDGYEYQCKACRNDTKNRQRARYREQNRYQKDKPKILIRTATRKKYGRASDYECALLGCFEVGQEFHHISYLSPDHALVLCREHHLLLHT